jgi:protein AATF/BFR2
MCRYHVHEKIQNFMIPIDANGWHEEQVDELFASLLGRSFPAAQTEAAAPQVEAGSLRIF